MDILELKKKQNELNLRLSGIIREETENFKKETGVSVESINVHFYPATEHRDIMPVFISGVVDTKLAL